METAVTVNGNVTKARDGETAETLSLQGNALTGLKIKSHDFRLVTIE